MERRSLERRIVEQCAPTLARLKCGSIIRIFDESTSEIEQMSEILRTKGVEITMLRSAGCKIAYIFRRDMLTDIVSNDDVRNFLSNNDYSCSCIDDLIDSLKKKMSSQKCIPHEIGVFLGYPLEDVTGFVDNCGQNYKCMGCWKVYGDEKKTTATFVKYRKCKNIYAEKFASGTPITKLTVS